MALPEGSHSAYFWKRPRMMYNENLAFMVVCCTVSEPIDIQKGDTAEIIMTKINKNLESWIRKHPEQWFWVHRRWGKDV